MANAVKNISKTIHVWLSNRYPEETAHTFPELGKMLQESDNVHTTLMECLSPKILNEGYSLTIHPYKGNKFVIQKDDSTPLGKQIKNGTNLKRIIMNGGYDDENHICVAETMFNFNK